MSDIPQSSRSLTVEFVFDTELHAGLAFNYFNSNYPDIGFAAPWKRGLIDLKTEIKVSQPSWDRQQVLREEWKPKESYFKDDEVAKHSQKPPEPQTQPSPYSDKANQILTSYNSLDELIDAIDERRYERHRQEIQTLKGDHTN